MAIKIKLLPPVLIGRYFQALVLYLTDFKIIEYSLDHVVADLTETELYEQLCKRIEEYYEKHGNIEGIPPKQLGSGFIEKVIGRETLEKYRKKIQELQKLKDSREEVQNTLKSFWCDVLRALTVDAEEVLERNGGLINLRLLMVKVNFNEFVKTYLVPPKGRRNNKDIDPIRTKEALYGEALAIAGMLMSKVESVDKKDIRVLPPLPESLKEGVLGNHVSQRYWAMVSHRPYFSKNLPISIDVYIHLHYAAAFAKANVFESLSVCMNPFDALTLVTISREGNRPIVTNSFLLMSSEIFCKLFNAIQDKRAVTSMLSNLLGLLRNEKVGDQAGKCLNNVYQYVISSDPQKLYDCARTLKALSLSLQSNLSGEEIARIERTIEYMARLG